MSHVSLMCLYSLPQVLCDVVYLYSSQVLVLGSFGQGATLTLSPERLQLLFPSDMHLPYTSTLQPLLERRAGSTGAVVSQTATFAITSKCATPVPFEISARLPAGVEPKCVWLEPTTGVMTHRRRMRHVSLCISHV